MTDPSGTTLKSVGKPLADHGYKIQILNLMDRSHSNKFNPFKYIKTKEEINILSVLQQKYGEEFTFKAWSCRSMGATIKMRMLPVNLCLVLRSRSTKEKPIMA